MNARERLDRTARDHFVYRAFDLRGRLLYVGCTHRPAQRWAEHLRWSLWARRARHFRVIGPLTYDVARDLERHVLATESPLFGWTPQRRAAHNTRCAASRRTAVAG